MRWPSLNVRTWQRPHLWDGTDTRLRGRCNCTPVLRALCKPALPTCTSHSLALLTQRPFVFPTPFLSPWSHCTCCCLHLEHIFFQSGLVKTSKYSRPGSNITSTGMSSETITPSHLGKIHFRVCASPVLYSEEHLPHSMILLKAPISSGMVYLSFSPGFLKQAYVLRILNWVSQPSTPASHAIVLPSVHL